MLRCLHILSSVNLEAGGVARCVIDLCQGLAQHGVDTTLATAEPDDVPQTWQTTHPPAHTPRCVVYDPAAPLDTLAPFIADHDAVHLHVPWDRLNPAVADACTRAHTPYAISVHGMLDDWSMAQKPLKKRTYWWLTARKLLNQAAFVHTTARAEADQAQQWFDHDRVVVAPLLMDPEPFRRAADVDPWPDLAGLDIKPDPATPRFLFLSRLHPKKGVERLIEAAADLKQRKIDVELWIAGPPHEPAYLDQLNRLADQQGVADRTRFLGMVRGDTKWALYRAADVFVLPTQQENFGLVLVEAMGSGLPVLTTTGVDIWRELEAGGAKVLGGKPTPTNDITQDWTDPDPIALALQPWLADPDLRRRVGTAGREYVRRWLDPQSVVEQYIAAYENALGDRS